MPFIPHTDEDTTAMLNTLGVKSIKALFDEIPENLRYGELNDIPAGLSEMGLSQLAQARSAQDANTLCFIGAGAYEHYIPAAVWDIASRGEFMTAYTPYQAEASQGTLQLIYEYQTMMASLTGMDVSNASMYDGATALVEAILMAKRCNRKNKSPRVLLPSTLHPHYKETVETLCPDCEWVTLPLDDKTGILDVTQLPDTDFNALVISQPNFFGALENIDHLTNWAHEHNALVIAVVNPTSLALLKAPGHWGEKGADIACGEGQPLGVPLASGGPYFGFFAAKKDLVRQMPGRIVGRTTDQNGKSGFVLTLQAREQHIRRAKATSNICTNQGLLVTAATIYMSIMGPQGLKSIASTSHHNTLQLTKALCEIDGVQQRFTSPVFHETVLQLTADIPAVLTALAKEGIQGGLHLGRYSPELNDCLLICATETKTPDMIAHYKAALANVMR